MPMERERYPADWQRIALAKKEAVGWRCERCGKQCRRPGEPFDACKNCREYTGNRCEEVIGDA